MSIPALVLTHALAALACHPAPVLIAVDMSQPMSADRMWVFDTSDPSRPVLVERTQVEHGYGSDPRRTGRATQFSNTPDSGMTSLGMYAVGAPYIGKHGRSYILDGLTPGRNTNANERDIRLHPVKKANGFSAGCLAVSEPVIPALEKKLGPLTGATVWVDGPGIKPPTCNCAVPSYWTSLPSWPAA